MKERKNLFFGILKFIFSLFLFFTASQFVFAEDHLLDASYIDVNSDGSIDHLKWTFDENIQQCDFDKRDWTVDLDGDIHFSIIGIDNSDPEGLNQGLCNGNDPIIYISISADFTKTGSLRNPIISYRDKGVKASLKSSSPILDVIRREQIDKTPPVLIATSLDLNDSISSLILSFTEVIQINNFDEGVFKITNQNATNSIILSKPTFSEDKKELIFHLTEGQRVMALSFFKEDELPQLNIKSSSISDEMMNGNKEINENIIEKISDTYQPKLKEWDFDFTKKQIILIFSETVDESSFKLGAISIQNLENSSSSKITLTGGELIKKTVMNFAIKLNDKDLNSIMEKSDLATSSANSFLSITSDLVKDLSGNSIVFIPGNTALQANHYNGNGLIGELTRAHFLLTNNSIAEKTDAIVSFQIENDVPVDGKIEILIPDDFKLDEMHWAEAITNIDGSFDLSVDKQNIIINRQGDGTVVPKGTNLSIRLSSMLNPRLEVHTDDFIFKTETAEGFLIDQNEHVNGQTIIFYPFSTQKKEKNSCEITDDDSNNSSQEEKIIDNIIDSPQSENTSKTSERYEELPLNTFDDIENHWAKNYINQIAELGIVNGKQKGIYAPDDAITRAELIKIAVNAFKYKFYKPEESFLPDVPLDAWYAPYIKSALDNELIFYPKIDFFPNHFASRSMAVMLIAKAANLTDLAQSTFNDLKESKSPFPDVNQSEEYFPYLLYLYENNVIDGYKNGYFGPDNPITRAEIAKIVVKTLDLIQREN